MRRIVILTLGVLALAGCDTVRENAGECPLAPPLRSEARPRPPVSEEEQIFQPGYWDWNGTTYAWREGVWIKKRPGQGTLWLDGFWKRDKVPGPCYWSPARWVN